MACQVEWLVEKRIFYTRLWGVQETQDLLDTDALFCQYLDAGTPLVHMILDVSNLEKFPLSLALIKSTNRFLQHSALGWALLVGRLGMVKLIALPLASMFKIRYRHFDTLDMAVDFLKKQDATIQWDTIADAFQSVSG